MVIPASVSVSLMELDRLGCDIKSSFTQVKKKCNRFVEKQNEVAILFVTSYNCFLLSIHACPDSGCSSFGLPWDDPYERKGDTGRYRLRFMLKFLRTALTL